MSPNNTPYTHDSSTIIFSIESTWMRSPSKPFFHLFIFIAYFEKSIDTLHINISPANESNVLRNC